jgi:hypothetical protein
MSSRQAEAGGGQRGARDAACGDVASSFLSEGSEPARVCTTNAPSMAARVIAKPAPLPPPSSTKPAHGALCAE